MIIKHEVMNMETKIVRLQRMLDEVNQEARDIQTQIFELEDEEA